jgi:hypothetical protein
MKKRRRRQMEYHRKAITNVHEHEKKVTFISDRGNANETIRFNFIPSI